jgi:hypothetical protein
MAYRDGVVECNILGNAVRLKSLFSFKLLFYI